MKATIERVSKFGVMIDGEWKNLSKYDEVSLDGFNAGDEVEIELKKDKFITKLEHLNGASNDKQGSSETAEDTGKAARKKTANASLGTPKNGGGSEQNRQESITRQSAYNAVLGSPWLGEFYKSMDYSQAVSEALALVDKLATYAQKGNPANN